jgi:hypothetical protein
MGYTPNKRLRLMLEPVLRNESVFPDFAGMDFIVGKNGYTDTIRVSLIDRSTRTVPIDSIFTIAKRIRKRANEMRSYV